MFFTQAQIVVWRNLYAWNFKHTTQSFIDDNNDEEFVWLPGPAAWWPEDYDSIQHGFYVPNDAVGARRAFEMLSELSEPQDFVWVFPSDNELTIIPKCQESADFLNEFYIN